MKNFFIASIIISSTGLVACSSQAAPSPTVTVTQSQKAPDPTPSITIDDPDTSSISNEELYLLGLRSMDNPILNSATDKELLDMGYSVCDALNAGFSADDVVEFMAEEMVKKGMTSDNEVSAVGYIIGAADSALCEVGAY